MLCLCLAPNFSWFKSIQFKLSIHLFFYTVENYHEPTLVFSLQPQGYPSLHIYYWRLNTKQLKFRKYLLKENFVLKEFTDQKNCKTFNFQILIRYFNFFLVFYFKHFKNSIYSYVVNTEICFEYIKNLGQGSGNSSGEKFKEIIENYTVEKVIVHICCFS